MKNVAWALIRYHNLDAASRILTDEAAEVDSVGMTDLGAALRLLAAQVDSARLKIEQLEIKTPYEGVIR